MVAARPPLSTPSKMLINFGPLLIFFAGSKLGKSLFLSGDLAMLGLKEADVASAIVGTAAFMVATVLAAAWSWLRTRHVPPAMLFTGAVVLILGGLTLWLKDKAFIQIKPSLIYAGFAALLGFGLLTGRPTLQIVMEDALPGVDAEGWRKLTRNWALFFLALMAANEAARRMLGYDDWLSFKVWGVTLAVFVFTALQGPLLARHGLKMD